MSIFTHPCQRPESLPLCKVSISTFRPHSCSVENVKVWLENPQNQTKPSATPPFQPASMLGVTCRTCHFHDVMSRYVVMSCHVVMLETDPYVCPCQYSPTHVKDQNPCLCVKCPFQRFAPTHVASRTSKSGSKTPKSDQTKCHAPFSARKHEGDDMSNMSFHDVISRHVVMSCHVVTLETDPCVWPCQYSPTLVKDQNPCLCVKCQFQRSRPQSCSV